MSKRSVLAACVQRMRGLSGKARDDAAAHFLAGAAAADPEAFGTEGELPSRYVDVLEALATVAEDD